MNPVLATAIATHGGWTRWESCSRFSLEVDLSGPMLASLNGARIVRGVRVEGSTRTPELVIDGLFEDGLSAWVGPGRIHLLDVHGRMPRTLSSSRTPTVDGGSLDLKAAFLAASSVWTALTGPFAFAAPDVVAEAVSDAESGEDRALRVSTQAEGRAFITRQVAHFDAGGLLRRLTCAPPEAHRMGLVHLCGGQVVFDGVVTPTLQQIHRTGGLQRTSSATLALSLVVKTAKFY